MRVLNGSEIQAVSGGVTFAEFVEVVGGKLIGEGAPTGLKSIVGLLVSPFALILGFVIAANSG
jgi:hypothetical protein